MSYQHLIEYLAPLETFDPEVFVADDHVPQEVCDLVLSLALAYNDFRDIFSAHHLLDEVAPTPDPTPTIERGLHGGLRNTLIRFQTGLVHELLKLLKSQHHVIEQPTFQAITRKLSRPQKAAWLALVAAARNSPSGDPLARTLLLIRNKVAFHYDAEQLGRGFESAFVKPASFRQPFISRGAKVSETRFYFADAAAQAYMFSKAGEGPAKNFLHGKGQILEALHLPLYHIVTRFIQSRCAWKPYKSGA